MYINLSFLKKIFNAKNGIAGLKHGAGALTISILTKLKINDGIANYQNKAVDTMSQYVQKLGVNNSAKIIEKAGEDLGLSDSDINDYINRYNNDKYKMDRTDVEIYEMSLYEAGIGYNNIMGKAKIGGALMGGVKGFVESGLVGAEEGELAGPEGAVAGGLIAGTTGAIKGAIAGYESGGFEGGTVNVLGVTGYASLNAFYRFTMTELAFKTMKKNMEKRGQEFSMVKATAYFTRNLGGFTRIGILTDLGNALENILGPEDSEPPFDDGTKEIMEKFEEYIQKDFPDLEDFDLDINEINNDFEIKPEHLLDKTDETDIDKLNKTIKNPEDKISIEDLNNFKDNILEEPPIEEPPIEEPPIEEPEYEEPEIEEPEYEEPPIEEPIKEPTKPETPIAPSIDTSTDGIFGDIPPIPQSPVSPPESSNPTTEDEYHEATRTDGKVLYSDGNYYPPGHKIGVDGYDYTTHSGWDNFWHKAIM
jgi:hypothetical protein